MINFKLENKTALVTGGASGIGLATVELLAQSGASVAVNDLPNNPALAEEVMRLSNKGYRIVAAPGDAGSPEDAPRMVQQAISDLGGKLDYLVNNAGTPGTKSVIAPDDFNSQNDVFWDKLLNVNLRGPARCTEASVSALKQSQGAIVNTASIAGIRGNGSSTVYSATKAGLITLTREYARALGPDVRVNAIAPGMVESNWDCSFDLDDETIQSVPMQRVGQPEDYAEVIVYLLAGAAYVTGEVVVVDGGLLTQ